MLLMPLQAFPVPLHVHLELFPTLDSTSCMHIGDWAPHARGTVQLWHQWWSCKSWAAFCLGEACWLLYQQGRTTPTSVAKRNNKIYFLFTLTIVNREESIYTWYNAAIQVAIVLIVMHWMQIIGNNGFLIYGGAAEKKFMLCQWKPTVRQLR